MDKKEAINLFKKYNSEQFPSDDTLREYLRVRREDECFEVVNRGLAWYNRLSKTQETELQTWYELWLDVTVSLVAPTRPSWIDS